MNSDEIKNRSVQTDLMRNSAYLLKAVACMDDEALQEISDIVVQIERLADKMERRIATPILAKSLEPTEDGRPKLTLVENLT